MSMLKSRLHRVVARRVSDSKNDYVEYLDRDRSAIFWVGFFRGYGVAIRKAKKRHEK